MVQKETDKKVLEVWWSLWKLGAIVSIPMFIVLAIGCHMIMKQSERAVEAPFEFIKAFTEDFKGEKDDTRQQ